MTERNGQTIIETSQEIPVLLDVDVAVAGGGTAGPIAAISAARQGAKVVMIERFGSLGGNLTIGLNTKPSGALPGGLPLELWDRARSIGAAGEDYVATLKHGQEAQVTAQADPELMKILLARMCRESGVQLLFETFVSRPIVEEHTVTGLIVESKGGRQAIRAGVVIDCSADADIAAKAGAPFFIGTGGGENTMQPVGMYFTVREVDLVRLASWARESLDDIPERHIPDTEEGLGQGLWLTGFNRMVRGFQARTGLEMKRESITLKTAGGGDVRERHPGVGSLRVVTSRNQRGHPGLLRPD